MDQKIEVALLGELKVSYQARPLELPKSKKTRALFALLALSPRGVRRAELCSLLFPTAKDPRASLRWSINQLRKFLPAPDALATSDRELLQLNPLHFQFDVELLQQSLSELEAAATNELEPETCAALTQTALTFGDTLLSNLNLSESPDFESWRLTEQARFQQLQSKLVTLLANANTQLESKTELARRLVKLDPLNESAWAQLVHALTRGGHLREAERAQTLAQQTLAQNNMPLLGELHQASKQKPQPVSTSSAQSHRYSLAVLPCSPAPGLEIENTTLSIFSNALMAAANANRTCAVIARSITHRTRQLAQDAQSFGQQIGADLVLDSQLYLKSSGYQLSLELIQVATGTCLYNWAKDIANVDPDQAADEITQYFSARFEIDLHIALIALAHGKKEHELRLWDRYFLALPRIYTPQGHDPEDSLNMLQAVIDEEPSMGPAVAAAAWVRTTHPKFNENVQDIAVTAQLGRRAVELCQDDTFIMSMAAMVIASTERDLDTAADIATRALTFNPASTMGLAAKGMLCHLKGDHEQAVAILANAQDAIDTEPVTFILRTYRALSLYLLGQSDLGLPLAQSACGRNPTFVVGRRALVLCLCGTNNMKEAKREARRLQQIDPSENLSFYRRQLGYRRRADINKIISDLKRAGVSEDRPAEA